MSLKVDYWDTHEMANQMLAVLGNQDFLHDTLLANACAEHERLSWAPIANACTTVTTARLTDTAAGCWSRTYEPARHSFVFARAPAIPDQALHHFDAGQNTITLMRPRQPREQRGNR